MSDAKRKLICQTTLKFGQNDADLIAWFALVKMTASRLIKAALYAAIEGRPFRMPDIPFALLKEEDMKPRYTLHFYTGDEILIEHLSTIDEGFRSSYIKNLIRNCLPGPIPMEYVRAAIAFYKATKPVKGSDEPYRKWREDARKRQKEKAALQKPETQKSAQSIHVIKPAEQQQPVRQEEQQPKIQVQEPAQSVQPEQPQPKVIGQQDAEAAAGTHPESETASYESRRALANDAVLGSLMSAAKFQRGRP